MLDGTPTWRDELAAIDRAHRENFAAYLRRNLAETQARRSEPQTRDDHAALADREAHFSNLLRMTQ